jgi:hypothetical protein
VYQRRRLKCEKLTGDGRQVMAKAHIPVLDITSSFFPHSYSVEGFGATILLLILAELSLGFFCFFANDRSDNR